MSKQLSVLYFGPASGTCLDRANALRRLGHHVEQIDLRRLLPQTQWVDRVTWRLGGHLLNPWVMRGLRPLLEGKRFDLCHVDGGEWVTPSVVNLLRHHVSRIVSYSIDDPFGTRDGARFKAFRKSLPYFDLNAVVREENLAEAHAFKARAAIRIFRSADELSHAPRLLTREDRLKWDSEVLFLGTWFPERGPFMVDLLRNNVPLTLRGAHWHKAPEWPLLKAHWKGGSIGGDDYAKAIQCAKVNIGLLSKANRDLHTTRSLEIPALRSLLCAERTTEHLAMYIEGQEALFWSDAQECAKVCHFALSDDPRREAIAKAGHQRVKKNGHYNEMVLSSILAACSPA